MAVKRVEIDADGSRQVLCYAWFNKIENDQDIFKLVTEKSPLVENFSFINGEVFEIDVSKLNLGPVSELNNADVLQNSNIETIKMLYGIKGELPAESIIKVVWSSIAAKTLL
ncbi:hypothetical protein AYI70_g4245 [Smittium culicis]|uniref:Uncharacterized protein n=1 Tax=Smittium culicis TaxID=133412 RepID=A0A1R1Y025_9FUNG|nr:hypothetical protein AYI70_g4245 [Smittium culicis]